MAQHKHKAAVIGLGSMGFGMAQSLLRAGFDVAGCDVSPDAARAIFNRLPEGEIRREVKARWANYR